MLPCVSSPPCRAETVGTSRSETGLLTQAQEKQLLKDRGYCFLSKVSPHPCEKDDKNMTTGDRHALSKRVKTHSVRAAVQDFDPQQNVLV